ncbi:MAG: restriction endonuclease [Gammaproteobacteria bacterium]|nr:restriction endonuclease [Gammaproteobacteria bacterium]
MAVIKVTEHQRLAIGNKLPGAHLSIAQARLLERIEAGLPSRAIEWGRASVKFSQFCGVIALGDDTLEVLPKIYGREDGGVEARHVLIHMLFTARRMKLHRGSFSAIGLQNRHLLDVFIRQFCEELFHQLRHGMIRRYVDRSDNLAVLRGKLKIDRHLRVNAMSAQRLYCEYDELIEDNAYNQVIKCVVSMLFGVCIAGATKRALTELLHRLDHVTSREVSVSELNSLQPDRTLSRYAATFEYCRWFLSNQNPDVSSGENRYLSLLLDMNRLFEEFVAVKLRRHAWSAGYRLRTQGPQQRLAVHDRSGEEVFAVRPDISLADGDGRLVAIMDTKWKRADEGERKLGVSQADLYQMVSYGHRYGCTEMLLLYPKTESLTRTHRLDVLPSGPRVHVVPVDLLSLTTSDGSEQWKVLSEALQGAA